MVTVTKSSATGRELLLEAAHELFRTRGYAEVSIQEIAEAAGMTKAAPYYHFRNKEDIFLQVFERVLEETKAGFVRHLGGEGTFRERLRRTVLFIEDATGGEINRLFDDFHQVLPIATQRAFMDRVLPQADFPRLLLPFFAAAHAAGEFSRTTPEVASSCFMMLTMARAEWSKFRRVQDADAASPMLSVDQLIDFFFQGA